MLGNQGIQTRNGCRLKILYLREDLDILDHVKGVFRPLLFFQFHLALWMVNTCEYHNQKYQTNAMFLLIPQPVEEWIIMVSFYCWPKMVIEEFGPQEMRPYMHVKLYYNIYI